MAIGEVLYPVNLVVAGRPCLVVGAGRIGARKAEGLLVAGARVQVVATVVGPEVRSMPLTWDERPYRSQDLEGVWLAIAATGDPEVDREVRADGDAAGVWVNSADEPSLCTFTLPSVVRQGPVMVTVSTGGRSPALAGWLKSHVAAELGPGWATLAELLGEAREQLRAQGRSTEDVDWRPVLEWSMLELVEAGDIARARERIRACLSSS